ncbi:MAG: DNA-directed RNA polymerase subunit L [Desulfurococcales archaeon]|nr:DNA-directed RNA polymerase subunit L [Desulfurococcales archaeon]
MVKIELRKLTDREVVIRLLNEDHTLGNLIAKMALKHPHVKMAAYVIEHPLEGSPTVRIITDGEVRAIDVLKDVIRESKDISSKILDVLNTMFSGKGS